jgi:hypothetical protein
MFTGEALLFSQTRRTKRLDGTGPFTARLPGESSLLGVLFAAQHDDPQKQDCQSCANHTN